MKQDANAENGKTGYTYAFVTLSNSIIDVTEIVGQYGNGTFLSRNDIGLVLNYKDSALSLHLSACVTYGLLENQKGEGYKPTELFNKINMPGSENEKTLSIYTALQRPTLFQKLISDHNGKQLPKDEHLLNILQRDFKITKSSAKIVVPVFMNNLRDLNVLGENNTLKLITAHLKGDLSGGKPTPKVDVQPPPPDDPELFEYKIPLKSGVFVIRYIKGSLKKQDFKAIRSAIKVLEIGELGEEYSEENNNHEN